MHARRSQRGLAARAASAARPAPGLARQLRESEFLVLSHIVALPVSAHQQTGNYLGSDS